CSGNTCRSPMAAAIANAQIAELLHGMPETVSASALSAGVSAREGSLMTAEAQEVLSSLNVPAGPHVARNLTAELAERAEVIYCMTSAHRKAVIEMIPSVAWKTFCLNESGDIDDPIGKGFDSYVNCAQQIYGLVKLRLNELGLQNQLQS